jgi:dipeptidyl aminopeptidase/acylaminoacyl peptidase
MKLRQFAALALAASTGSIALAQAVPPEKAFGALESVQDADLSPDGTLMSFIAPRVGGGNSLFVVPADGSAAPKLLVSSTGDPEVFNWCNWIGKTRMACNVGALARASGYVVGGSRIIAINADGSNTKVLTRRRATDAVYVSNYGGDIVDLLPNEDGSVLMLQWNVPEDRVGSLIRKDKEGFSLDRIDTHTLQTRSVTPASIEIEEYITDGLGTPRVMGAARYTGDYTRTGVIRYQYKKKTGGNWIDLGEFNQNDRSGFNPIAVDPNEDVVFGFRKENGRQALFKRSLDGTSTETLVLAHPQVDVDSLVRIGRKRRVIGVSYATESRQVEFFDPDLMKLRNSLGKALPGSPSIGFFGASDDEKRLLIFASSDTDPGKYYLLDRTTKQMRPLLEVRPQLGDYKLAEVKPVQVKATDGTLIPGYLTLPPGSSGKNLPTLVMPHGGPESRDEWGFGWLAQYFAHRGFAVLQPNFRGSAGYGESWFLKNGYQSWRTAIGDVADAGRWAVSQGIADPSKLAILGWSYGGYAALQSGVVAPDLFKAIVAIAPVTDLAEHRDRDLNTTLAKMTRTRIGSGPHVTEGSPYRNADKIKAPVMMFHGDLDQNVWVNQSKMMEDALKSRGKSVQLFLYPKLDHYLISAAAREEMLSKSDAFLRTTMGMK